jgi:hypothetical protein
VLATAFPAESRKYPNLLLPPRVIYCCGSDHFRKCGLDGGLMTGVGVCVVCRAGDSCPPNPARIVYSVTVEDDTSEYSSTLVRREMSTAVKATQAGKAAGSEGSEDEVFRRFREQVRMIVPDGVIDSLVDWMRTRASQPVG